MASFRTYNMTYTENDLSQCVAAMEEASTLGDLEMNEYEKQAFNRMWDLCRQFLAEHERLIATSGEYE